MKKALALLASVFAIIACSNNSSSNKKSSAKEIEKARLEREAFVRDSLRRDQEIKDSIALAEKNAEVIARVSKSFTEKKDEFSTRSWVEPKSAPKYRNRNGVYCYFATEDGKASSNFRFVYQYYADDWLFIKNMIFNIDDEIITITPEMDTDCGNGGMIWEWCDKLVTESSVDGITEDFIKKIANAKSVKVKMNGRQYYDTRTLTKEQIQSIKDTYDYFIARGGTFL